MASSPPERSRAGSRRWRGWLVGGLVVVIALGLGGGIGVMRSGDEDEGALAVAPQGLDLADLKPALLNAGDVGGDFRQAADAGDEELSSDILQMSDKCRAAFEQIGAGIPTASG